MRVITPVIILREILHAPPRLNFFRAETFYTDPHHSTWTPSFVQENVSVALN